MLSNATVTRLTAYNTIVASDAVFLITSKTYTTNEYNVFREGMLSVLMLSYPPRVSTIALVPL